MCVELCAMCTRCTWLLRAMHQFSAMLCCMCCMWTVARTAAGMHIGRGTTPNPLSQVPGDFAQQPNSAAFPQGLTQCSRRWAGWYSNVGWGCNAAVLPDPRGQRGVCACVVCVFCASADQQHISLLHTRHIGSASIFGKAYTQF